MSQPVGYADDWSEIATEIKQTAGYRCSSCGLRCLSGSNSYRHLDLSLRRRLCAQVHHIDGNPSHNDKSNLVCLCSGCHLAMHRPRQVTTAAARPVLAGTSNMTFDPFGDFKELGYLRNIAGFKDLAMVKALEHGSFQRNLDRAITELADAKFIEYKQILNIHKTLFGDNVI